jgi:DNA-directed RNA polymerase specialized sigma24 family protein
MQMTMLRLYDRLGPAAYRLAWALTGQDQAAQELVAGTLERIMGDGLPGSDAAVFLRLCSALRTQAGSQTAYAQAAGRLPERNRLTFELAYFGGFTVRQIAGALGEPDRSVMGTLREALETLRLALPHESKEVAHAGARR